MLHHENENQNKYKTKDLVIWYYKMRKYKESPGYAELVSPYTLVDSCADRDKQHS